MDNRLLKYEFWKEHTAYYLNLFSGVLSKKDRAKKREYFAQEIIKIFSRPIRWLDIGTGDGSKIFDIIHHIKECESTATIELIVVEPSKYIITELKEKLSKIEGVSFEIRNEKFSLEMLQPNTFDCVTFFHVAYYLANEQAEFKRIYEHAYNSLRPGGALLIQAVNENSDFQKLGHPSYSDWALGEHSFALLKKISPRTTKENFSTRLDITDFLTQKDFIPELEEKLLNLYRFTTQVDSALPTKENREKFISHMRELSEQNNNTFYLDFSDVVISLHKPN